MESSKETELSLSSFDMVVRSIEVLGEIEAISGESGIDIELMDGDSTVGDTALSRVSSQPLNQSSKSLGRNDGVGSRSMLDLCDDWIYLRFE